MGEATDPRIEAERLIVEATSLAAKDRFAEAEDCYRTLLALDPLRAEAYFGLAQLAQKAGNGAECLRYAELALTLKPNNHAFHFVHGLACGMLGNLDYSLSAYQRSLKLYPAGIQAMMNLIFTADLHPSTTPEHALALRKRFDETFCQPYMKASQAAFGPHKRRLDPDRRLRVGYVSGDFRAHSAAAAFGPIILGHDQEQYEVYCYSSLNPPEAEHQRNEFADVANLRNIEDMNPGEQAQEIANDRIDILVDLSGFSGGSALQAFALRPAPIQVSAWGYITGTGMAAMDYLFADAVTVPEGCEGWYAEKVVRLPAIFPYAHTLAPGIQAPAPWQRNGYKTYGYLGRGTKITYATLDAWAEVLRRDPTSRFVVKSDSYKQQDHWRFVVNGLIARGVDVDRVQRNYGTSREDHLEFHNTVDVILDTVPQTGGISTCDALLMGVPVVTLAGKRIPERVSASILTSIGYDALVCQTVDEYARTALALQPTAEDRASIRAALGASPLADHAGYTQAVETVYRNLWRGYCAEALARQQAASEEAA